MTLHEEPNLHIPKIDTELPNLKKDRNELLDPNWQKSFSEIELPQRLIPKTEILLPSLAKFLRLIVMV
jgi:hypothetical protein